MVIYSSSRAGGRPSPAGYCSLLGLACAATFGPAAFAALPAAFLQVQPTPQFISVVEFPPGAIDATITDVEPLDFNNDGQIDLAVAYYVTYSSNPGLNRRRLHLYRGSGGTLVYHHSFNLYVPDSKVDAFSVFRNGTGDIGVGDFDGDHDLDLAVGAFFGDELWLIENLGQGNFATWLKFPYDFNSPSNFITPPEMGAADFDGDGRDELVYLVDPIQHIQGKLIHFWKTTSSIAAMQRVAWEGLEGAIFTQWTRALAIADFDADGRPDLCYTGTDHPPLEDGPILTFWHGLNPSTGTFRVHHEFPDFLMADVAVIPQSYGCRPGFVLTDLQGSLVECWTSTVGGCTAGSIGYAPSLRLTGYSAYSVDRGMSAVVGDLNGDGRMDVITKQRLGGLQQPDQVEITLNVSASPYWTRVTDHPLDSSGLPNSSGNPILRPRNVAIADISGNRRPEVIAASGRILASPPATTRDRLVLAIWPNSCPGDVDGNGRTRPDDQLVVRTALDLCQPSAEYVPSADLNRDGCITQADYDLVTGNLWCSCCGSLRGDLNCDDAYSAADISPFVLALTNLSLYQRDFPTCDPAQADVNGDGQVSLADIEAFIQVLLLR